MLLISCYIRSLLKIFNENQAKKFNIELFKSLGDYNIKLNEMRAHVHYDTLTGARSRIFLIQESMRLLDNNILFSLVYIDLNSLKRINDTQGHQKGDDYITTVANILKQNIQNDKDILFRYGGDEFVIVFVNPSLDISRHMSSISGIILKKSYELNLPMQISYGYQSSKGLDDFTTIFSMADKDMYKMKKMHKQLNPNLIRAR